MSNYKISLDDGLGGSLCETVPQTKTDSDAAFAVLLVQMIGSGWAPVQTAVPTAYKITVTDTTSSIVLFETVPQTKTDSDTAFNVLLVQMIGSGCSVVQTAV